MQSFFLLLDRLRFLVDPVTVPPLRTISVVLPPASTQWICVESSSREDVMDLCQNLSTFLHPLEIHYIPVDKRLDWLGWNKRTPIITPNSWVRLKRRAQLRVLLRNDAKFDKRLMKYAKDLAYVHRCFADEIVMICLVPRLLVPVVSEDAGQEQDGEGKKRRLKKKRCPRLLHTQLLVYPQEAAQINNSLDPDLWWDPKSTYELEPIVPGVYQLAKPKCVKGGDDFMPPFVYFAVPSSALRTRDVIPSMSELKLFGEGMAIGERQLHFPSPHPDFLRWSYENHVAAPVEVGQRVEIKLDAGMARGVTVDICVDRAVVRVDVTEVDMDVDARCIRRFYNVGDTVKVILSSNRNREGWVVNEQGDEITVIDSNRKEQVGTSSICV